MDGLWHSSGRANCARFLGLQLIWQWATRERQTAKALSASIPGGRSVLLQPAIFTTSKTELRSFEIPGCSQEYCRALKLWARKTLVCYSLEPFFNRILVAAQTRWCNFALASLLFAVGHLNGNQTFEFAGFFIQKPECIRFTVPCASTAFADFPVRGGGGHENYELTRFAMVLGHNIGGDRKLVARDCFSRLDKNETAQQHFAFRARLF